MQLKKIIKENIQDLKAYEPGKPIEEVKRILGLKEVIKLASNENPLGPSPKAVVAIRKNLNIINRYPDGSGFYLKKSLAKHFKIKSKNIILGNGSDEIIDIIIKTFLKTNEEVITSDSTFLEYAIITKANAGKLRTFPLIDFRYDLCRIKKEINAKTKLIFIANPNNPTGTCVGKFEVEEFLKGLPPSVIVVFDEAYNEFVSADDFPHTLDYFRQNKNIIILRTFSKAYGLAGLRIGFGIADEKLVGFMERVRQPFNTNSLAQAAGVAALTDKQFLRKTKRVIAEGKIYLYRQFENLDIEFMPTQANFILFKIYPVRKDFSNGVNRAKSIADILLKKGVIVRDMEQYGLHNFLRVTIGAEKENRRFIKVLKEVIRRKK